MNMKKNVRKLISLSMIVATVFIVFINIFFSVLDNFVDIRFDLTQNNAFQIESSTKSILSEFKSEVKILVLAKEEDFTSNSVYNAQANQVFEQFALYGHSITLDYIDFVSDPSISNTYPAMQIKYGDIILETPANAYHIRTEDLFNYTYSQTGQPTIVSSSAEEALLTGLLAVTSDVKPKVALINGHAEYDMPEFVDLLERNNYNVSTVNLITEDLSNDINAVAMFAPKNDLSLEELEKIDKFLENNGEYKKFFLYTADPGQKELPNLSVFLREWGVGISSGSIFETNENRVYNYQPFYGIVDYVDIEFQDKLLSNTIPMLMPLARPIQVLFESRNNYSTRVLTQFAKSSGVRPENAPQDFSAEMATEFGPLPALVLSTRRLQNTTNSPSSQVLVSGSTAFIDVFALKNASFSNSEYILNVINAHANNDQSFRVLPKKIIGNNLNLTRFQANLIGSLFVFVVPACMLVMAVFIYIRRKSL